MSADFSSRTYKPDPQKCCERCVFGTGEHAEWCTALPSEQELTEPTEEYPPDGFYYDFDNILPAMQDIPWRE